MFETIEIPTTLLLGVDNADGLEVTPVEWLQALLADYWDVVDPTTVADLQAQHAAYMAAVRLCEGLQEATRGEIHRRRMENWG